MEKNSNACVYYSLSRVQLFATSWTAAHRAPLSMGFSRQEYWSGLPFPSLGDLPNPGIQAESSELLADSLPQSIWEAIRTEQGWESKIWTWILALPLACFLHGRVTVISSHQTFLTCIVEVTNFTS